MKQFKHSKSNLIVAQNEIFYPFHVYCATVKNSTGHNVTFVIPASVVENSNDWKEIKDPLFVTDDFKPIYEGGECWYVNREFEVKHWKNIKQYRSGVEGYHYFSTEKLANDYSENNKLQFNIADIEVELTKWCVPGCGSNFKRIFCENLKEAKKSK